MVLTCWGCELPASAPSEHLPPPGFLFLVCQDLSNVYRKHQYWLLLLPLVPLRLVRISLLSPLRLLPCQRPNPVVVYLRAVGGESASPATLAPKVGPLGMVFACSVAFDRVGPQEGR